MAKPNYAFEKRQKELAKKQKKLEKLEQRKAAGSHEEATEVADSDMESEMETGTAVEELTTATSAQDKN